MQSVKEAITAFKEARKAFRVAQMDPTILGPEQMQMQDKMNSLTDNTFDLLSQSATTGPRGAAGHQGGDFDLDFIPGMENGQGLGGEDDILERTNIARKDAGEDINKQDGDQSSKDKEAQGDDKDDDNKDKEAQGKDDDDKDETKKEMDAMKLKIAKMEYKEAKMKLAQTYAQLFPEPMREAKTQSFMATNESIRVLTARVDEATNFLAPKTGDAIKVAQTEEGIFDLQDLDGNGNSGNLDMAGKI